MKIQPRIKLQIMDSDISKSAVDQESVASTDDQTLVESIDALTITPKDPEDVLARCNVLLDELKKFADYCDQRKYLTEYRHKIEFSHFKGDITKEIEQMQKVGPLPIVSTKSKLTITRYKTKICLQDEFISLLQLQI